jgi:hypothetical protein
MRGTVAKRIRRQVYGDFSHRARDYKARMLDKFIALFKAKKISRVPFAVVNSGLRAEYLKAKKNYITGVLYEHL